MADKVYYIQADADYMRNVTDSCQQVYESLRDFFRNKSIFNQADMSFEQHEAWDNLWMLMTVAEDGWTSTEELFYEIEGMINDADDNADDDEEE